MKATEGEAINLHPRAVRVLDPVQLGRQETEVVNFSFYLLLLIRP